MMHPPEVEELVIQALESGASAEDTCSDAPALLPAVRAGLERVRAFAAELDALFPPAAGAKPPPADPTDPLPAIPGHEVTALLGRGGMGVVYAARHLRLGRTVAVKMLLAGAEAGPAALERFRREARAVAALHHANIIQVHEVGDEAGAPWFSMEYLEGGTLAQRLAGTPHACPRAAELVATLATAMHSAHQTGIVHRDLKPSNVLFAADGTPKIVDFGLARCLRGDAALTLSGAAIGTPSYMAPEQARSDTAAIGPATDVYALGAILYESLTGRPPFRADSMTETLRQVMEEDPAPPRRINPKVDRALETIALTCLHKDPARRYPSAAVLAEDLRRFLRGEPIVARPAGGAERAVKWMRRHPARTVALAGAAVAAVAALAAGLWLRSERAAIALAVEADLREFAEQEQDLRWSDARTALERAKARLGTSGPAALRDEVARGERELALVAELEAIRLARADFRTDPEAGLSVDAQAAIAYAAAFARAGLDVAGATAADLAGRIRASGARLALVAALDDWALCAHDVEERRTLLEVARAVGLEADSWCSRVRDPATWRDLPRLEELAAAAPITRESLSLCLTLAARLHAAGGDPVPFLERVQHAYPGDFWANTRLGIALGDVDPARSVRFHQAAVALRPDAAMAYSNLGAALGASGRLDEAILVLEEALRLDPELAHAHSNLGNALMAAGRPEQAIEHFRATARLDPGLASPLSNWGRALVMLGRLDQALERMEAAVALHPDYANAHNGLGYVLNEAGRPEEALAHLDVAVARDPRFAGAHVNRGNALRALGRLAESEQAFRTALALDPDLPEAHNGLGVTLNQSGRPQEAIAPLERAIALRPDDAEHHNNLGAAYAALKRNDAALAAFDAALQLDPARVLTRINRGKVLANQGRLDEAAREFEHALSLDPDSGSAHGALGLVHLAAGRSEEARAAFARALEMLPERDPERAFYAECAARAEEAVSRGSPR